MPPHGIDPTERLSTASFAPHPILPDVNGVLVTLNNLLGESAVLALVTSVRQVGLVVQLVVLRYDLK